MLNKFTYCGFLALAIVPASAQVASHAPTAIQQAPSQASAAPAATTPVVRVNGSVLTEADLVREEYTIFPYARQHGGLPAELAPQIRNGALQMIIFEELVYQETLRRHMIVPPAKMQRAEIEFRKQFATPEEFNSLLQAEFHGSQKLLNEKIRRSLMIDAFLQTEVENKSIVTPAEVRAFYDKNQARFHHPESFRFQTISVLPPARANAEQLSEGRKRSESALKQAKATKSAEQFGLLAEKISDDDYRVMMGQHQPIPVDQLAPQVLKALYAMKTGDVSDLIQIEQAYTIVRLQEHIPAGEARFDEVKAQILKDLRLKKREQLRTALDKKLRLNAKIEQM